MHAALMVAGGMSLLLAAGHTLVGRAWVLDRLPRDFQPTPFGDASLTRGAVVFTWHALGLMLTTMGVLLIALGQGEPADARDRVLVVVGGAFACATALLLWNTRRRPFDLLRAPIWVLTIVIAILCWLNA